MKNTAVVFSGVALVGVIGFLDHITAEMLDVSVLYLVPVALTVWFAGRKRALPVSVLAVLVWEAEQLLPHMGRDFGAVTAANLTLRFAFFVFAVYVISRLKADLEREKYLARTDVLTGAVNRRAFFENLEAVMRHQAKCGCTYSLMYFDIDNFKKINDTHGHRHGDRVLAEASAVMMAQAGDAGGTFARIGGDEFAVILPDTDEKKASDFIAGVKSKLHSAGGPLAGVTFSFGVVVVKGKHPDSAEELLHKADELMYDIKKKSKDAVHIEII